MNIRERTKLTASASVGDETLTVQSTQGYPDGEIVYVGELSREGCERGVVESIDDETTISLVDPLELPHTRFSDVIAVLGDTIRIYRTDNVDDRVPADDAFTLLATRSIDPDQLSTYYRDSEGTSAHWYRWTYYNATTSEETDPSTPIRGDDFGHYASISEIRREAGFENAHNLSDLNIDEQRRAAEAEINTRLAGKFKTPFNPVPEIIRIRTRQLAAALLKAKYLPGTTSEKELKTIRALIDGMKTGDDIVTDDEGNNVSTSEGISSWPDETAPRAFEMGMKF
ncbi:hypothetical protein [Rhodococcus sp. NPDC004095]